MKLIIFFIVTVISLNCFGGTRDESVPDQTHIDYAANTDYILKLYGIDNEGDNVVASAVALNPRWIITAAHIVKDGKAFYTEYDKKKINLIKIIPHENFKKYNFGYNDIAVCKLDTDLNLNFYPELYFDKNEINKQAYICGYGMTGTFSTGVTTVDSNKRAGTNMIDKLEKNLLICGIGSYGKNPKTKYEFLICGGDSGGGLFIDKKLAGIHSCVIARDGNPNSNYGDTSGHTRVSLYYNWIKQRIEND
jgi:V8-like Glu-specific endopeptidase